MTEILPEILKVRDHWMTLSLEAESRQEAKEAGDNLKKIIDMLINLQLQERRMEILRLLETAECNENPETIKYCKEWLEELKSRVPDHLTTKESPVLILASYCDNPDCSDERPCLHCLEMCNVAIAEVRGIKIVGGWDTMGYTKT